MHYPYSPGKGGLAGPHALLLIIVVSVKNEICGPCTVRNHKINIRYLPSPQGIVADLPCRRFDLRHRWLYTNSQNRMGVLHIL